MKAEHRALVAGGVDPTVSATELLPLFKCNSAAEADAIVASVRTRLGLPAHTEPAVAQAAAAASAPAAASAAAAAAAPTPAPLPASAAPPLHPTPTAEPSGPFPLDMKNGLTLARVHEVLGLCEAAEEFGTLVRAALPSTPRRANTRARTCGKRAPHPVRPFRAPALVIRVQCQFIEVCFGSHECLSRSFVLPPEVAHAARVPSMDLDSSPTSATSESPSHLPSVIMGPAPTSAAAVRAGAVVTSPSASSATGSTAPLPTPSGAPAATPSSVSSRSTPTAASGSSAAAARALGHETSVTVPSPSPAAGAGGASAASASGHGAGHWSSEFLLPGSTASPLSPFSMRQSCDVDTDAALAAYAALNTVALKHASVLTAMASARRRVVADIQKMRPSTQESALRVLLILCADSGLEDPSAKAHVLNFCRLLSSLSPAAQKQLSHWFATVASKAKVLAAASDSLVSWLGRELSDRGEEALGLDSVASAAHAMHARSKCKDAASRMLQHSLDWSQQYITLRLYEGRVSTEDGTSTLADVPSVWRSARACVCARALTNALALLLPCPPCSLPRHSVDGRAESCERGVPPGARSVRCSL
ncbi:hypothetical protein EON68_00040 [archaeon]|nr:MAG: hypothetical protein EON68_00040 [archaeon]